MASFGGLQINDTKSKKAFDNGGTPGTVDYTVPAGMQLIISHLRYHSTHADSFMRVYPADTPSVPVSFYEGVQTNVICPTLPLILGPGDRVYCVGKGTAAVAYAEMVAVLQSNS